MSMPLGSRDSKAVSAALFDADISAIERTTVDDSALHDPDVSFHGADVHTRQRAPIRMFLMDSSFDEDGVPVVGRPVRHVNDDNDDVDDDGSSIHTNPSVHDAHLSGAAARNAAFNDSRPAVVPDSDMDEVDSRAWGSPTASVAYSNAFHSDTSAARAAPGPRRGGSAANNSNCDNDDDGDDDDDDVVLFMSPNRAASGSDNGSVAGDDKEPGSAAGSPVQNLGAAEKAMLSSPPRIRRTDSPKSGVDHARSASGGGGSGG